MIRSFTEENYLKAIFKLSGKTAGKVSTNSIAEELQTKASSVTDMLKKLGDRFLVIHTRYQGVQLTEKGQKCALDIVRKHRLWEVFLVEKLGFAWDEVHEVAEELEHIRSEKLINQLEQETTEPIKIIKQLIPDLASKIAGKNQGKIIDALNLILTKRDFYQEDVFKAIAQVLLEKKPNLIDCNEEELVRCNRLLLEVSFPQLILKAPPPYTLKPIASSRYWQPTEPVILMVGEGVKPTIRHGQDGRLRDDGLLECEILQQEEDIFSMDFRLFSVRLIR